MQQLENGTLLQGGKYRIIRFISSGGFGCTYEAEHVLLENRVAIKEFFVKDFCNRDENTGHITMGTNSKRGLVDKLRRKFIDEARALFQLHHDSIVRVTDIFEENGTAYFVMDYIDGKSLGEVIKIEGALPETRALKYIRQVAEALRYVHDNNRLHLDVKPGNIMIDGNDNAILIDFGASKQYDEEDGENTSTLIGKTPGYAPIEQMGNDVVKFVPATDIYALGATLYKAISGITPPSSNLLSSGEELDLSSLNISKYIRQAIFQSMQVRKKDRPADIESFMSLLNAEFKESIGRTELRLKEWDNSFKGRILNIMLTIDSSVFLRAILVFIMLFISSSCIFVYYDYGTSEIGLFGYIVYLGLAVIFLVVLDNIKNFLIYDLENKVENKRIYKMRFKLTDLNTTNLRIFNLYLNTIYRPKYSKFNIFIKILSYGFVLSFLIMVMSKYLKYILYKSGVIL